MNGAKNGPPKHIPASELFVRLQEIPRPSISVDFPRTDEEGQLPKTVRLWVLTQEEHIICTAATEQFVRKHLPDGKKGQLGYEDMYSNEMAVQMLYRACRLEEDTRRAAFATPDEIRKGLDTLEVGLLFKHYLTVELELGPIVAQMTVEEMDAWVSRIAEGGSAFPFDSLSSELQKILVLFMARQLRSSPTDTSSAGTPPKDGSSDSESDVDEEGASEETAEEFTNDDF